MIDKKLSIIVLAYILAAFALTHWFDQPKADPVQEQLSAKPQNTAVGVSNYHDTGK
jgi:hypothetical protein